MATLAEIRAQYPQYKDMSDQQLADGLYGKFYSDMPREEFNAKVGVVPQSQTMTDALAAGSEASQFFGKPAEANLLDRGQSFAQGVIEGLPVVGPALANARVEADALLAQLPGGMTPEEVRAQAAERKAFLTEKAGNERLAGNITGAVVPLAAAGMAAPVVGTALGMTGGLGSQVVLGGLSSAAISAADAKARGAEWDEAGWSALKGGGIGAGAPLLIKGAGMAVNALRGNGVPKAAQNIGQALADDGLTPESLNSMLADKGMGTMVADLGPNLQTLGGGVASVRGPGQTVLRSAVEQRAKAAPAVIRDVVNTTVGQGQAFGLANDFVAAQKAAADPLYEAVRDVPLELEGNIKFVADTPLGRAAFKQAREWAANDGYTGEALTVGVLDYAKQALDDAAGAARRQGKGNEARQPATLAKMLATAADVVAPGYKQARDAFAGPAAILEALESGQVAFTRDLSPEAMEATLKGMTTSEKEGYIEGAIQSVSDLMGNSANDVVALRTLIRKPYNEAKLRMLMGDDAANELLRAVDTQLMQGNTSNAVANNAETARRRAAQGMVDPDFQNVQPPSQSIHGLVLAGLNASRAKLRAIMQPRVNRQMAELLTSQQLTPAQVFQLGRAMKHPAMLPVAPASVPQLTGTGNSPRDQRKPLEILIDYDGKP